MKKILILVLIALPVVWWVKNPQAARQKTAQVFRVIEKQAGGLANRLEPMTESDGEEVADPSLITLPEKIYVLRENVPAKPNPVPGVIAKGTQVRVIGDGGSRKIVSDGTREAIVDDTVLTRDPKEVTALLKSVQQGRQMMASQRREELEAELTKIDAKLASVKKELNAVRERDARAKAEGKNSPQYGTQEQFLLTEITRQEGFRDAVVKQLQALR